jgi:predicted RNA-binding protein with PIN domain
MGEICVLQDLLIVDGYNVINAWAELIALKEESIDHARDKLIDILASYGMYHDLRVTVVFDAHMVPGQENREIRANVEVIYTNEGETADSCIEKMVYYLVHQGQRAYVVTSDYAEQLSILGSGAFRISSRELHQNMQKTNKLLQENYTSSVLNYRRQELENRLNHDMVKRLNEMRKRR